MATPLSLPIMQWVDTNGDPLAGGKMYFYITGTSTPLDTFSDSALSVANANPLVADASGTFGAVYPKAGGTYKIVLKTSADVTLWTADPVYSTATTGSLFYLSDYSTLPLADAAAAAANGVLFINDDKTLTANYTQTCKAFILAGGVITTGTYTLTITNVEGPRIQGFNASGGKVTLSSSDNRIREFPIEWMGALPNTGGDVTTQIAAALDTTAGRIWATAGPGKYIGSSDLSTLVTTSPYKMMLKGANPSRIWGAHDNAWLTSITNSSDYNQDPPSWMAQEFTVFQWTGAGFWGQADAGGVVKATNIRPFFEDFVIFAKTGCLMGSHIGITGAGGHFKNVHFIQCGNVGVCLRYGESVNIIDCDFIDCGHALTSSGSLAANGASTYGSGAGYWLLSETAAETYFATNGPNKHTAHRISGGIVWVRNHTQTNKSGFRRGIIYNAGDFLIENNQSTSGLMVIDSFGTIINDHGETYSASGTTAGSATNLWAQYLHDSSVSFVGGWLGKGGQIHNGANVSAEQPWYLSRMGTYTTTGLQAVGTAAVSPFRHGSKGMPSRWGDLGLQTNTSIAGTGSDDDFTWQSVFEDAPGFHGIIFISLNLSTNVAARRTSMFVVQAQHGASYSSAVSSESNVITTFGADYGVTVTPSIANTAGREGQDLVVNISWTGANWTAGLDVDVNVVAIGGGVQSIV